MTVVKQIEIESAVTQVLNIKETRHEAMVEAQNPMGVFLFSLSLTPFLFRNDVTKTTHIPLYRVENLKEYFNFRNKQI